ncbi:MAG: CaiB/BaiF CoA-transferase family protein [Aestuariivirgaceae bacterium]
MGQGPLNGIRIVEFAGIGPGPFCGMLLSDMGADVIRIDRKDARPSAPHQITQRGRRSLALDLKAPAAVALCLELFASAEMVFEVYRPGVMERLGLGPAAALKVNPRLVYGRMTGWGQSGPLAHSAGHDINYIAISGALHAIGTSERPVVPLNLIGDYGGGALYLAMGLLAALIHARQTGEGQIVDAAMCEGAASLMAHFYGMSAAGTHGRERATNMLDGGAPFYNVYRCADDKWIALGAIEPQFHALLLEKTGLADLASSPQMARESWPALTARIAAVIAGKSQAEWCAILEGTDACFAPVLDMTEAPAHHHNRARNSFVEIAGVVQPAPAPRFSSTPTAVQGPPPEIGEHNSAALGDWGLSEARIEGLRRDGVI